MRDVIDPISQNEIDDNNERMTGEIDGDSDDSKELVFNDGDELKLNEIAGAAGVGEPSCSYSRDQHQREQLWRRAYYVFGDFGLLEYG